MTSKNAVADYCALMINYWPLINGPNSVNANVCSRLVFPYFSLDISKNEF